MAQFTEFTQFRKHLHAFFFYKNSVKNFEVLNIDYYQFIEECQFIEEKEIFFLIFINKKFKIKNVLKID